MTQRSLLPSLLQNTVGPSDMVAWNSCLVGGGTVGNATSRGRPHRTHPGILISTWKVQEAEVLEKYPLEGKVGAHGIQIWSLMWLYYCSQAMEVWGNMN